MKTLAIFAEELSGGGVEKVLQTLLIHWNYAEYDVTLYTIRDIPVPDCLSGLPFRHRFVFGSTNRKLSHNVWAWLKNKVKLFVYYHSTPGLFYRLIIRERFDVAIGFIEGYATRIVSGAPSPIKRIAWLHCDIINHHWTEIAYRNNQEEIDCYRCLDTVVCISSGIQMQLQKWCGEDLKTRVILNPIDRDDILKKAESCLVFKEKTSMTATRIVSFGRLVPIKGYDRLIRTVRRLLDDGDDVSLYILGEGKERSRLQTLIKEEKMEKRVFLLGYKENPYPYLKDSSIYVCSSYSEGYNTAIAEALVLGKAVVSTDCMKGNDLLGDSEYGIVTDNSEDGLFFGLRKMTCPGVMEQYSFRAKQKGDSFSIDNSLTEIYSMINAL